MKKLTTDGTREIISDLAKLIKQRAHEGPKPERTLIDFRADRAAGHERDVYFVPVELLLYRKNNGRISSDVLSHERNRGKIVEASEEGQAILRQFLQEKDKEKRKYGSKKLNFKSRRLYAPKKRLGR